MDVPVYTEKSTWIWDRATKREIDQQKREIDQQKKVNDHQKRVNDQQKQEIDQQKREIDRLQKNTHGQQPTKRAQPKQPTKPSAKKVGYKTEQLRISIQTHCIICVSNLYSYVAKYVSVFQI